MWVFGWIATWTACVAASPDGTGAGRPGVPTSDGVRRALAAELAAYHRAAWRAHLTGRDVERYLPGRPVDARTREGRAKLPRAVRISHDYYLARVEQADWGSVRVCQAVLAGLPVWVTWVTTDGDDGWVEVHDVAGGLVGAARMYLEVLGWEPVDVLRARVGTGTFPETMADRATRTVWSRRAGP
jgi:hypothetical protein